PAKLVVSVRKKPSFFTARKTKNIFWGIEVPDSLTWQGWCLGKEFTKHLILRNVCLKPQKLKFRPPTTRFFNTVFPQPIILSPGMSITLPIIFCPLEKKEYEDSVLFEKAEGEFSVALVAKLPHLDLLFQESIQLPSCAVYDSTEASFTMYNDGELLTCFSWEVPPSFCILPSRGMLDPGEECTMKVIFQPEMAQVHNISAICSFGDTPEQKAIQLKAVAKYPHLLVNVPGDSCEDARLRNFRDVLCFGAVAAGSTVEKYVDVFNVSVVSAPFRIERAKEVVLRDRVFSCDTTQNIAPARGKSVIPVRFSPHTVGVKSVDYFTVLPAGSVTHSVLKVTGSCKGPEVSFQHPVVYFSCINLGEYLVQPLEMTNNSDVPAYYQFNIDCKQSVFSFDRPVGVLDGMSTITLKVTFQPTYPIIFYRRVVCLVHHQDPLFIDLIGTCHSETMSPNILRLSDITRYKTHMARGLTFFPPDILGTMLKEGKLLVDETGALTLPPEMLEDKPPEEYPALEPMVEYFHDGVSSDLTVFPPHVSLSIKEYDFGCCAKLQEVQPLPFCVTNHTKGKITVIWTNKPHSPFQVLPEICDIPPLKTMAFHVTFKPSLLNSMYAAELEGFAFYKVLRNFNNIEEPITMCPSWDLAISLRGHTFQPGRQHFIPKYDLDCHKVFPPVSPNITTYRSMLLSNVGSTAISFSLSQEKCPSILVKPNCGYIAPGAHQIILLSTCPVETSIQQHILSMQFNFWPSFTQELHLQSSAEPLVLLLEGDGCLYFKPTHVGSSSSRTFTIKNCTRLPMLFRWKIQQSDKNILSVQPAEGTILPNEALAQTWTFTPSEQIKYLLRSWVVVWREQEILEDNTPKTARYILRVIGEGSQGTLTVSDSIRGRRSNQDHVGRGWKSNHRSASLFCLPMQAANPLGEKQPLCQVTATGVYPSICITDACGTGSASGISKLFLWRLFSLEALNQYLELDPTPQELTFRVPTRHSTRLIPPVYTPVMLDFNFGAAPVRSVPSVVVLMLQNNGGIPMSWAFLFPSDQRIEMEYWAESTEFDPSELHQMRIQDNQLFAISPKAGKLLPGQEQAIHLSYRHDFIGTDRLPVLLKISHGREILLNFIGVTLQMEHRYIHFTSTKHMFTPIAIGTYDPPKQIYELYNGGATTAMYEIQVDALMKVQEENYQHGVFVCLNPRGEIGPGLTAHTEWIFSPLEAKMYSVEVPIHILEGDSALITFQGIGFDPHVMGESAQFDKVVCAATTPGSAKLIVPGLTVYLSHPRICFGNIPVYSKCSRLFFLNNASENEAIVFSWHTGTSNSMVVSFICLIALVAGVQTCRMLKLQEWEAEKARQAVEFTITEKDLDTQKNLKQFPTLPPIRNIHVPNPPASRSQRKLTRNKDASRLWVKPEPPKPFLMHLGVTARSHSTDDYLVNFPNDLTQHFLFRRSRSRSRSRSKSGTPSLTALASCTEQEAQLVTDMLSTVIKGLLEESQFQEAVIRSLAEPTPYFCQFWSEESAKQKHSPGGTSTTPTSPEFSPKCRAEDEDAGGVQERSPTETSEAQESLSVIIRKEQFRELPAFSNLTEMVLENTIRNVLVEASRGEVVLTARPRIIALPTVFSQNRLWCLSRGGEEVSEHGSSSAGGLLLTRQQKAEVLVAMLSPTLLGCEALYAWLQ
uniref:Cilia and flagella associated protein 65 n=1 Tax=Podarcis muralis TaxID=64176 RepID=A0A670JW57_PODMU